MNSVYIVLEFSHSEKLIPAVNKIESLTAVAGWDAVLGRSGHANLVLRARGEIKPLLAEIERLDGWKQSSVYELAAGEALPAPPEHLPIRAYLFVDVVPGQLESVREAIVALPDTVFCTRMASNCDLVAMVKGESIAQLKSAMQESLQTLDGVLRLRAHYVFNIKEL